MEEYRELDWDDQIEDDGPEFIILPPGDYDFEVTDFERGRHQGSDNLPPCNKAIVYLRIEGKEGATTIKHQLFLHTKTEGLLCAFFTGIGQRKKGERITMNWDKVIGATGRAKIGIRKWTNDKGETLEFNEVKRFYEPEDNTPKFKPGEF
ncbi:MAG TPA: DUF669 domain-containing protein [Syntrophomonadaceae bacterium]|nr:DUF669 domain-containing protein [Syntrophomonadaceae bacterium]